MAEPSSTSSPASPDRRPKRERSVRYPGVTLAESIRLSGSVESLGVDGLPASAIASALGFTNIKTNTFSAGLSAARQFGLLTLTGDGYALTPLAKAILHPVEPSELPRLHRQALLKPPLYAELAERLRGKKVPDVGILANVLYHQHHIIASAKQSAAEAFLESARFAGALGDDGTFRPEGTDSPEAAMMLPAPPLTGSVEAPSPAPPIVPTPAPPPRPRSTEVRLDLRLWDADEGKTIRLRAPQSITPASFDRFLQAFRLLVRVEEPEVEREEET